MITAHQAKTLSDDGEKSLYHHWRAVVDTAISDAARSGDRSCNVRVMNNYLISMAAELREAGFTIKYNSYSLVLNIAW